MTYDEELNLGTHSVFVVGSRTKVVGFYSRRTPSRSTNLYHPKLYGRKKTLWHRPTKTALPNYGREFGWPRGPEQCSYIAAQAIPPLACPQTQYRGLRQGFCSLAVPPDAPILTIRPALCHLFHRQTRITKIDPEYRYSRGTRWLTKTSTTFQFHTACMGSMTPNSTHSGSDGHRSPNVGP